MTNLHKVEKFLNDYLQTYKYESDGFCNGLSIEGKKEVRKIALGVTPCLELFKKADNWGADAIITHHSLDDKEAFKKPLQGVTKDRIAFLLNKKISLLAYHLSLDFHPEVGNNVLILDKLGAEFKEQTGELGGFRGIFSIGEFKNSITSKDLIKRISKNFKTNPDTVLAGKDKIKTLAVVSGGAANHDVLFQLSPKKIDLYLTGEIKEHVPPIIKEIGINFVAAGHYATETLGVKELGKKLESEFNIETKFIDINIPY